MVPFLLLLCIHLWITNSLINKDCSQSTCTQTFIYPKTTADSVTFTCLTAQECAGLVIYYGSAGTLTVNCHGEQNSCQNVKVFCGNFDPPDTTSPTDMDASNVRCDVMCDQQYAYQPPCFNTLLSCKGNGVEHCVMGGYNDGMVDSSTVECNIGDDISSKCQFWCNEVCTNSYLLCHTGSDCRCSQCGSGVTTIDPATYSPTTAAPTLPTTTSPTTSMPTTFRPTTAVPTTNIPTTNVPTTASPTTNIPTTSFPTTINPTASPTTINPTTTIPTTAIPTTSIPTTNIPTTAFPTTLFPTTSYPSSQSPSTNSPITSTATMDMNVTTNEASTTLPTTFVSSISISTSNDSGRGDTAATNTNKDLFSFENILLYGIVGVAVLINLIVVILCVWLVVVKIYKRKKQRNKNKRSVLHTSTLEMGCNINAIHIQPIDDDDDDDIDKQMIFGVSPSGTTTGGMDVIHDEDQMINHIIHHLPSSGTETQQNEFNHFNDNDNDNDNDEIYEEYPATMDGMDSNNIDNEDDDSLWDQTAATITTAGM